MLVSGINLTNVFTNTKAQNMWADLPFQNVYGPVFLDPRFMVDLQIRILSRLLQTQFLPKASLISGEDVSVCQGRPSCSQPGSSCLLPQLVTGDHVQTTGEQEGASHSSPHQLHHGVSSAKDAAPSSEMLFSLHTGPSFYPWLQSRAFPVNFLYPSQALSIDQ